MTEYITKEELSKLISDCSSIDCTGATYVIDEKFHRAINLTLDRMFEVVGYVTSYQTNAEEKHLSIGFNPTVRKLDEGSPLYALNGDSK
jgi:hypothetical protein